MLHQLVFLTYRVIDGAPSVHIAQRVRHKYSASLGGKSDHGDESLADTAAR